MRDTFSFHHQRWNLLFLLASCVILGVFLALSRYSLPKTDDFANMMYGFQNLERTPNIFRSSYEFMKNSYMQQQGTFTAAYAAVFLLVKIGTNLHRYYQVSGCFVLFAFLSYFIFLHTIAKHFHFRALWGVYLFSALWIAVDFVGPGEAVLYVNGACVYCFPLALGFLGIACYLKLMESDHIRSCILWSLLAAGCSFFSTGGVLMVAAMTNIYMVWIFLYDWFDKGKFPVHGIFPFLCAFTGALFNTLAPGNFIRYTSSIGDTKPDFLGSIRNTFLITWQQLFHLMKFTYFFAAIVLVTLFVLFIKTDLAKEHFRIHPVALLIANYISCYLAIFPTVLGYHLSLGDELQERMMFTFAWIASGLLFLTWIYTLLWIRVRLFPEWQPRKFLLPLAGIILLLGVFANWRLIQHARPIGTAPTLTTIYREYTSGSLDNYYAAYRLALQKADDLPVSGQCFIFYEFPETQLFMESSMSAYPEWWINQTCAAVYQLSLFDYCPEHPFSEADVIEAGYTMEQLLP